ncbi:HEAT repeat domain-containing protein [Streptomyces syringium]|uniref:HEAT repeat domain-containing protein n=1 Tax=Streptomyces syringium TaxID=76729 RepID=UPI00343B7D98
MSSPLEEASTVLNGDEKSAYPEALLKLHAVGGEEADTAVMNFVRRMSAMDHLDDLYEIEVHGMAVRVAAELDPDRDVEPFLDLLDPAPSGNRLVRKVMTWGPLAYPDTFPRSPWGYTRLRRLDPPPVARYTARLLAKSRTVRVSAAMALGDTADLTALDPLAEALTDPSQDVRVSAVNSVRRLRHAGAANELQGHPAEAGLVDALSSRQPLVHEAAVQALVLLERTDMVKDVIRSGDSGGRLKRALDRGITPLPRTWPGDETTL